jgi:signal transduction histidine kinase/Tfp pilus assembly protein PilF
MFHSFHKLLKTIFWLLILSLNFVQIFGRVQSDSPLLENPTLKILIDSLNNEKNNAERVRLLNAISWNYAVIDFEKGILFGDSAFSLASKLNLKNEQGVALNNIGESMRFKGDISGSIEKHQRALNIFRLENNQSGLADTYRKLGISYFNISNFSKSLENFNDALLIYESINDKNGVAKISGHMGILYGTLNEYDKALASFTTALNYTEKVGAKVESAIQYGNLAIIYEKQRDYTKALKYYAQAIQIFKEMNDQLNYYTNLGNLGLVYISLKNYSKAESAINEALSIAQQLKDEYGVAYQYGSLGILNYKMALDEGKIKSTAERDRLLDNSISYFKSAVEKFDQLGVLDEQKNYLFQLASSYEAANDYRSALETYIKASELKDSIFAASTKKQIEELEVKQHLIIKEKQVEILSKENQYNEIVLAALVGFLILLSGMLVFIVITFQKKRKDNILLQKNIQMREKVEKELRINEAKLEEYQLHLEKVVDERTKDLLTEIAERRRAESESIIAKENAERSDRLKSEFLAQMTHEIRTPLTGILGQFSMLFSEEANLYPELRERFAEIKISSSRLIKTVESILKMAELTSGSYNYKKENFDLKDVLNQVVMNYKSKILSKGLRFNVSFEDSHFPVKLDRNSTFQILNNIVDNAYTYTEEGEIIINLIKINGLTAIEIEDTGIGISESYFPYLYEPFIQEEGGYGRTFEGNGLGLALTKKYCDLNKIDINITSQKNVGTKVKLIFDS